MADVSRENLPNLTLVRGTLVGRGMVAGAIVLIAMIGLAGSATSALAQVPPSAQPDRIIDRPEIDRPEIDTPQEIIVVPDEEDFPDDASTEKIFVLRNVILEPRDARSSHAGPRGSSR